MSDTSEGSSNAAQSAQEPENQSGLLSRILGAFSSGESDTDPSESNEWKNGPKMPSLLNLHQVRLDDVYIPKADIVAVPDDISKDDLVQTFRESGLTRLPVYEGTLDTPIGMIHLKDLALKHGFNGHSDFQMRKILRPMLYAPPSMPVAVLLQKMQTDRTHMALVIDEYGGVDGLVTIEDLIEQIIGEIEDEHDIAEGRFWTEEKPGCYLAQAKTPLEDFEGAIGQSLTDHDDIDEEEIDTLGGLVFMLTGRVPARGEVVVHPAGPEFEVVDADPRRIKRLRVRVP
ncbi:hemolysin family protein [Pseudaestuariivita rosea]|uniref:hemolysin family protein n=1 Tax=Pseudaestuariivita rosea TaxID=2763263 RepID=UPI001ABB3952|nr:hemolysin family protein [Pseudaestuariivita rosea]